MDRILHVPERNFVLITCYKFRDNGCYNLKGLYVSNYLIGNMEVRNTQMKIKENKQNALSEELKLSLFINKEKVYIGITRWSYSQLLIIKRIMRRAIR